MKSTTDYKGNRQNDGYLLKAWDWAPMRTSNDERLNVELNPENRETPRFEHEATVLIENYPAGKYHEGRMYNYSRTGMYFESDYAPQVGTDLFIGIENSPYSSDHDVRRAKVVWCNKLPDNASYFYYGVGVKYY